MNGEQLIDEVQGIVDDEDYMDRDTVLVKINQAQRMLADNLFLPDLKDGYDTVDTVADLFQVALPVDFHKNIYLAIFGGNPVDIHQDLASMVLRTGHGPRLDAGDVERLAEHRGNLIYQRVPTTVSPIELFYYRLPLPIEDTTSSHPDGARGNDDFEWALIHHAAARVFNDIEDGMEGAKINTTKHEGLLAERFALLDRYAEFKGESHRKRPSSGLGFLGAE